VRTLSVSAVPAHRWRISSVECTAALPQGLLYALLACQNATEMADRPGDLPTCAAELRAQLALPYRGRRVLHLMHDEAGNLVAWGRLGLYSAFHAEVAHAAITVHPAVRRRGAGSALLRSLSATAAQHGRARLVLDGPRTAAAEAFAARHALVLSSRELRSRLDLFRMRIAAPHPGGFVALRWSGPCPEQLIDSYVDALDTLNAAPAAGTRTPGPGPGLGYQAGYQAGYRPGYQAGQRFGQPKYAQQIGQPSSLPPWQPAGAGSAPFSVAEVHHREQLALTAGLREYTACLVNPRRRQIVALSSAHTADGLRGEQNETVVIPQYRGLGLATLVKTQLIRELLGAERGLEVLDTYNALDNTRMLAVNRRLGFRPLDTHAAWTLRLGGRAAGR
jgi:GNAT superfamily N-acetyltransferase